MSGSETPETPDRISIVDHFMIETQTPKAPPDKITTLSACSTLKGVLGRSKLVIDVALALSLEQESLFIGFSTPNFKVDGDGVRGVDDRCGSASKHVSGRWNKLDGGAARPLSGPPRARPMLDDGAAGGGAIRSRQGRPSSTIMRLGRGVDLLRLDRNAARLTLNAERTSSGLAAVWLGLRSTAVRLGLRPTAVRLGEAFGRTGGGWRERCSNFASGSPCDRRRRRRDLGADREGGGSDTSPSPTGTWVASGRTASERAASTLAALERAAWERWRQQLWVASESPPSRITSGRRGWPRSMSQGASGIGEERRGSALGRLALLHRRGSCDLWCDAGGFGAMQAALMRCGRPWSNAGGLGGDALGCGRRGATRAASERASVRRLERSDASGRGRRGAMRRCRRRRILMGENIRPLRHMSLKVPCPAWWVPVPGQLVVDEAHHAGVDRSAEMRGHATAAIGEGARALGLSVMGSWAVRDRGMMESWVIVTGLWDDRDGIVG
uniref:Uncharacterized protein n=1 Tax=Ananas comosus var. bracteatus TaxID=296719 RepID=A0A6V7PRT7_ANACO|nr:unnamed protein product [Ananas comosus var. bracteatus]